jgi:hypothetical protein
MNEKHWVALIVARLRPLLAERDHALQIVQGQKLPYTREVRRYRAGKPLSHSSLSYETDILISEQIDESEWLPRLIIEAKIKSVTTHDAITYSQKAATHKAVHPYLRYGIILGRRQHHPLPGRLFRHGAHFDFMLSFADFEPARKELADLLALVLDEVTASRQLEEIIFNSRNPNRKRYTLLQRPLRLE